jgi:hypothetical protein
MIKEGPAIGVVFEIHRLGEDYSKRAWTLFMRHAQPDRIAGTLIRDGETGETISGDGDDFCITVSGNEEAIAHLRDVFSAIQSPEMAPMQRRFLEGDRLLDQPLPRMGTIDAQGRLVTDAWDETLHALCLEHGWAYAPQDTPADLPPERIEELERLASPRPKEDIAPTDDRTPTRSSQTDSRSPDESRRWWRFWGGR